jgi:hypothetical protein
MGKIRFRILSAVLGIGLFLSFNTVGAQLAPFQAGWPKSVQGNNETSYVVADLDLDGNLEIIGVSRTSYDSSNVYVWNAQGSLFSGWPKSFSRISGTVSVGNLDDREDLEIVFSTFDEAKVYAYKKNGTLLSGWPQTSNGPRIYVRAVTLGDIDGDGDLEVVVVTNFGGIHAWHHNGTLLPGFPVSAGGFCYSPVSLADLDRDGDLELITAVHWGTDGWVTAFHHVDKDGDGNIDLMTNYTPRAGSGFTGDVVMADLDADESTELLCATGNGSVYAWKPTGKLMRGWPLKMNNGTHALAVADFDNNGDLEIIAALAGVNIHVWHHNGIPYSPWPVDFHQKFPHAVIGYSPVIADIDGDNRLEILLHHGSGVYAYKLTGGLVPGWPLTASQNLIDSPSLVIDLDGDKDLEILASSLSQVYVWDVAAEYDAAFIAWNGYQHDRYHSGNYSQRIPLRATSKGYTQVKRALKAAQSGDYVIANPRLFTQPAYVKSGIDLQWRISK